jgi:hypothetical protein
MRSPTATVRTKRWLVWTATVIAGLVGLFCGFDFGNRLAGMWLGAVLALNGALFCSIVVAAAAEKLTQRGDKVSE